MEAVLHTTQGNQPPQLFYRVTWLARLPCVILLKKTPLLSSIFLSGIDLIAAFYGCLYAGCVPVNVRPPHPQNLAATLPTVRMIIDVSLQFLYLFFISLAKTCLLLNVYVLDWYEKKLLICLKRSPSGTVGHRDKLWIIVYVHVSSRVISFWPRLAASLIHAECVFLLFQVSKAACILTTQHLMRTLRSKEAAASVNIKTWPTIIDTGETTHLHLCVNYIRLTLFYSASAQPQDPETEVFKYDSAISFIHLHWCFYCSAMSICLSQNVSFPKSRKIQYVPLAHSSVQISNLTYILTLNMDVRLC